MNDENNSGNKNLSAIDILNKSKGQSKKNTEHDIDKLNNDLRRLYGYLKREIFEWDNIYVDMKEGWFSFKVDGIYNRNIVAFAFRKDYMYLTLPFKPMDSKNIFNQCKHENKHSVQTIFIASNEKVLIDPTGGYPDPKKIILEIDENDDKKINYSFKKEDGEEIKINYIIKFIKQSYEFLIKKFQ